MCTGRAQYAALIDSVIWPEECAVALNNTYQARLVQQETAVGAGVQILLLALLGTAIGMGPAGWLTGLAFAVATWAVLSRALHRTRPRSFGPANRVTLGRATLVGGVTALVADSYQDSPPVTLFVGLTAVALILDGVDGKVARATGTSTPLGARFDMEVDAFLIHSGLVVRPGHPVAVAHAPGGPGGGGRAAGAGVRGGGAGAGGGGLLKPGRLEGQLVSGTR